MANLYAFHTVRSSWKANSDNLNGIAYFMIDQTEVFYNNPILAFK